jgi:LPXTG-site transpeptidase (sortase) family protein
MFLDTGLSSKRLRIAFFLLAFFMSLFPVEAVQASLISFSGGITATGTTPFDSLDPDGDNLLIRNFDYVSYRFTYVISSTGLGNNSYIELNLQDGTPPAGYSGPAVGHTMTWFQIPASCLNPEYDPAQLDPGESGFTVDGQTLICQLGDITTAQQQTIDFRARVLGHVPNGTILPSPVVVIGADGVTPIPADPDTEGGVMGLPDLTSVAEPRWDVEIGNSVGVFNYAPGSGPSGEDGVIASYRIGVKLNGSRYGAEALDGDLLIYLDVDGLPDGARPMTWPYPPKLDEPDSCKPLNHTDYPLESVSGNVRDLGPVDTAYPDTVANGGTCAATQPGGADTQVIVTLSGFDSTLNHYPIYRRVSQEPLINPYNLNDSSNQWYIINKTLYLWIPIDDFLFGEHTYPTSINTEAYSITGQPNNDVGNTIPPTGNNTREDPFIRELSGSFSKIFYVLDTTGGEFAPRDPNLVGTGNVTMAEPGQRFTSRFSLVNNGTETLYDSMICEKIDNTRLTAQDINDPPGLFDSHFWPEEAAFILRNLSSGYSERLTTGYTVDWGVGGSWASFNTSRHRYTIPYKVGSDHADGRCDDPGIIWYASFYDVPNPESITHVRITLPELEPQDQALFFVSILTRETYLYDTLDILRDSTTETFLAGDPTAGGFGVNQVYAVLPTIGTALYRHSDIVEIVRSTFPQISKQAVGLANHALVGTGQTITYELFPNLTSPGELAFGAEVIVTDVLPPEMTYAGSATFGGSPIVPQIIPNDPAVGYTKLVFNLGTQITGLGQPGNASGDLDPIRFNATVNLSGSDGDNLLNSASIDADYSRYGICEYDLGSDPIDSQDDEGYKTQDETSLADCQYSNWTLEIDNPPGFRISKNSTQSLVELEQPIHYEMTYSIVGATIEDLRIIDVLPYNGDGRTPPSDFSGTLALTNVSLPANDPAAVVYYTRNAPVNIHGDPYDSSNTNLTGSGVNGTNNTVWCLESQFGSGNCPASLGEVTGILVVTNPNLPPDVVYAIGITLQPTGNQIGDIYTNAYSAGSPNFTEFLLSNDVPINVVSGGLTGNVYLDNNNNGVFDTSAGEWGIGNVVVAVECISGPSCTPGTIYSTRTGSDGSYSFTAGDGDIYAGEGAAGTPIADFSGLLSGIWEVRETQPAGYIDGQDTAGSLGGTAGNDVISGILMPAGGLGTAYNFGERLTGSIGDRVWADHNRNGIQNVDEGGLTGVTVTLEGDLLGGGTINRTTTTGEDGIYNFIDLPFGTYTVTVVRASLPAGYTIQTYDLDGLATADEAVVEITQSVPDREDVDFGYAADVYGSISGYVYADMNNDGIKDPDEWGIQGVTVWIECLGGNEAFEGAVYSTRTGPEGAYAFAAGETDIFLGEVVGGTPIGDFAGLGTCTWQINEEQPYGYRDGIDTAGNYGGVVADDQIEMVLPEGGEAVEYNFGEWLIIEPELPPTGFAPGVVTEVTAGTGLALGDGRFELRIPSLGVRSAISGIRYDPLGRSWDVSWLSGVGWLEGTAFPTWEGRTVLTAHNYRANGLAGPFAELESLSYGDLIEVEVNGATTTYMVTSVQVVSENTSWPVLGHVTGDVLTLLTCYGAYIPDSGYVYRLVVEAVPVD